MAFDLASFAAGLVLGVLVGILAGYLHETEAIGELQERVRTALLQLERITPRARNGPEEASVRADLHDQILELQEEIKKLYRRQGR